VANAVVGVDSMTIQYVSPVPSPVNPVTPVTVVASHEELVRSARDLWAVAVSLLTELTPDKFVTAPWAAALFTGELPFILAKLWHMQQAIITSAHSYLENEAMLLTVLETIDVPKLFQELSSWAIELGPLKNLPFGIGAHVPPVNVLAPENIQIIEQRYAESTWSGQLLIRHEQYLLPDGSAKHWFYLPKSSGWDVFTQPQPEILTKLQESLDITSATEVQLVGMAGGQLVTPETGKLQEIQGLEGIVTVYKVEKA
jgi:hypothetical protein